MCTVAEVWVPVWVVCWLWSTCEVRRSAGFEPPVDVMWVCCTMLLMPERPGGLCCPLMQFEQSTFVAGVLWSPLWVLVPDVQETVL